MQGAVDPLPDGEDLYAVLDLPRDASEDDVRHAYRRLARTSHPDLGGGAGAADRFRRITAAYEVLGNTQRRASYDRDRRLRERGRGPSAAQHAPGPTGGTVRSRPIPPTTQRTQGRPPEEPTPLWSVDDWSAVRILGKLAVAAALVVSLAIGALVIVAVVREPDPLPAPTIFCRTPDGWLDCRRATQPGMP
ncbi:MAG TPA: J domain-containing protein [Actinomycetota bacterium]|jgi:DnaJ domain|nr:J domain-containing protein [Actinomycetota bacterium]